MRLSRAGDETSSHAGLGIRAWYREPEVHHRSPRQRGEGRRGFVERSLNLRISSSKIVTMVGLSTRIG